MIGQGMLCNEKTWSKKKKDCLLNLGVVTQNVEQTELKEKHEYILQSAKRCIQGE